MPTSDETPVVAKPDDVAESTPSLFAACVRKPLLGSIIVALLLVHGALVYFTASYCTVTHDEYWHVPVGLLNLTHQQFDFDNLNPPLGRMVAAAPLLLMTDHSVDPDPEVKTDLWDYGDDFLAEHGDRYHRLIVAARVPGVPLSMFFGLVAAMWSTQLFGVRSGLATLVLWTFSPSIISNAALATNDLFVSGLFLIALWRSMQLANPNARKTAWLVGLAIGAACLVKFTGLLLFAVIPVTALIGRMGTTSPISLSKAAVRIFGAFVVSIVVINAGYLFHGSLISLSDFSFESLACQSIQNRVVSVADLPVPLPKSFMAGIDHQKAMMEGAHPIYLNGEWRQSGFLSYFVWVIAWKLPHGFQLLLGLSAWSWFRDRRSGSVRSGSTPGMLVLILPTLLLFVIGSISDMQLGLRYILPSIPLLMIVAASAISTTAPAGLSLKSVVFWLLIATSVAPVRFHPHHLSYFNELSGGPKNGWKLLSDSNIDWGQDLLALKSYLDKHDEVTDLKLAYFGTFPPGALGLQYSLPGAEPQPGWYAISVNIMQGRPNPIRKSDGSTQTVFGDSFGYLRFFEPVAKIGESIRVYHLTEDDLSRRRIEMFQAK